MHGLEPYIEILVNQKKHGLSKSRDVVVKITEECVFGVLEDLAENIQAFEYNSGRALIVVVKMKNKAHQLQHLDSPIITKFIFVALRVSFGR